MPAGATWLLGRFGAVLAVLLLAAVTALPARAVEVQRVVSPGGIEAWLVEDHTNPILSLDLVFRGGAALDPTGKQGVANLVASTMDEGAGDLDSQAFQGRLDALSISLRFGAGADSFTGTLRTLSENRDAAFELLRLALTAPRFDEEPVERIRAQILIGLSRASEDPDSIASRSLSKIFFPDHPYGRSSNGTRETVEAITRHDLVTFVRNRFGRDNLVVGVVGDVTPAELAQLLDSTFLDLPAEAAPASHAETKPAGLGELVVVEREIPQSVVVFGHGGLLRDDPDYYAAYVVNHIFGGGSFSSRLYDEVREKRGLAYSVYSFLSPFDYSALMIGGVATQNQRVAESLEIIRAEWRRMAEEGPGEEELRRAKTFLTGSFPLRFSSSGSISGMLAGIQHNKLGIDYLDRRNSYVEAVSLEDARRVARRLLDADALTVVVVGKPSGLTPSRPAPDLD